MTTQTADKMSLIDTHNTMFEISFPCSNKMTHNQPFWDTHPQNYYCMMISKTNSTITCHQKYSIKHVQSILNSICQHFEVMYTLKYTNNWRTNDGM